MKWLSRQSLQNLWPHFVKIGSFSSSLQIAHYNSSSTSLTKSSSYPPSDSWSEGLASASAMLSQYGCLSVIAKWKKWDLMINQIMLAVSQMIIVPDMTSLLLFRESEPWRSIVHFNNSTGTSVDDDARQSNRWLDQRQSGKLGTGSGVQSFPRAFLSSTDVPVLLLNQPINN